MLIPRLQAIHHPQHLGRISASARRIAHDQPNRLFGIDDEDAADRKGNALLIDIGGILVVEHIIKIGYLAGFVADDGEAEGRAGNFVNVLDPATMALNGVGGEADELDAALGEFGFEFGKGTEFCVRKLLTFVVFAPSASRCHSTYPSCILECSPLDG